METDLCWSVGKLRFLPATFWQMRAADKSRSWQPIKASHLAVDSVRNKFSVFPTHGKEALMVKKKEGLSPVTMTTHTHTHWQVRESHVTTGDTATGTGSSQIAIGRAISVCLSILSCSIFYHWHTDGCRPLPQLGKLLCVSLLRCGEGVGPSAIGRRADMSRRGLSACTHR